MIKKKIHIKLPVFVLLLIVFLSASSFASAQETIVVGNIVNKTDRTPIAGVSIFFKNSKVITHSDEEGYFLIRTTENYNTLIFSCIGYKQEQIKIKPKLSFLGLGTSSYKQEQIKIKPGQSLGIEVQLEEENTMLQEVFVVPGINPAIELMKKTRLMAKENDITHKKGFNAMSSVQNLVLLSRISQQSVSKRIFDQLKKGNLSDSDSSLVLPLYMTESKYMLTASGPKELSRKIFSSPKNGQEFLENFVGQLSVDLNFYNNSVSIFGKSIISPLANVGNAYYRFYLADSIHAATGKQYEIHFKSRNPKNLAFNGELWIDSASLSLTKIQAELSPAANINFVRHLRIAESFGKRPNNYWARQTEEMALDMDYQLLADSLNLKPEVFVKRRADYLYTDSVFEKTNNFAQSQYTRESLDEKLKDLNNTPLLRTARWIADVALTGYADFGKVDVGKIMTLGRISDIEGLRVNLPLRTNEKLWRDVSIGGSVGYCTKNKTVKYSAFGQYRLPGEKKRVVGLSFVDDYRRIDYNYNNFLYLQNPLVTGDEDIVGTLLVLSSAKKLNPRKEVCLSLSNDWNSDIESNLYLRTHRMYSNSNLPMTQNANAFTSFLYRSATLNTRFSFGEKTYEDHLQRIYIANENPVVSLAVEGGQYILDTQSGWYGKFMGAIQQTMHFDFGNLVYVAEAGCIAGKVPYPLLEIPMGTLGGGSGIFQVNVPTENGGYGGYSLHRYNMMKYMEYGADKYVNLHSELTLNGLLMNQIPLIKHLNLRELFSFKIAYGSIGNSHRSVLDYPDFMDPMKKPYIEIGTGITNILRLFSIQSVWRLTDTHKPGVFPWGFRGSLNISF